MDAFLEADALGIYLSGGATNINPSASLGGVISSKLIRGMTPQYTEPVQGLMVVDATPENGEGIAQVSIVGDLCRYTPPGGTAGPGVSIAEGETKVLTGGDDVTKAARIYRVPNQAFVGLAKFRLVDIMSGAMGLGDITSADRVAGAIHYRAGFIKAQSPLVDLIMWVETAGQSAFGLAVETPAGSAIQTIPNEDTGPGGVDWVWASSEETAIEVGNMSQDALMGMWIGRYFAPGGDVASKEVAAFNVKFKA